MIYHEVIAKQVLVILNVYRMSQYVTYHLKNKRITDSYLRLSMISWTNQGTLSQIINFSINHSCNCFVIDTKPIRL